MAFTYRTQLFAAVLFFALATSVIGHSYVTSPSSRSNQAETQTGCRGPACLGPCEVPLSRKTRSPHTAKRGDAITVKWPRNNHAGGFIRFAWAPTSQSDSMAAFDAHVQQINCHEVGGCYPDDPSSPNGGDSGPADGSSRACSSALTVPLDLADGQWTLQWAWFGGAFGLGDYYSCIDYSISGGANGTLTPKFVGGDYAFPNQPKCKFFNTDKLHVCINEPCNNPIYPYATQQSGTPAADQLGVVINTPTAPVTTASAPVVPATSASVPVVPATPSTTGSAPVAPMTSASVSMTSASVPVVVPATTASVPVVVIPVPPVVPATPSTTGSTVMTPVTTSAPATPSSSSTTSATATSGTGCVLGDQICVGGNQYQTCTNARVGTYWAAPQTCQVGLSCHPSTTENKIYCY